MQRTLNPALDFSAEVADAIRAQSPIVALESTIISHGFPYPANIECARRTEEIVREAGAVPATIAVLGGRPTVGLTDDQLEHIATAGRQNIAKASRRDLALLAASGGDGATTVAGTMIVASMAGIRLFATGGIGGAHRGAQETFDISADLMELARTEVAVVCAGAKSVLDLALTLEILETHGVPVLGYRTDEFPAFYTRTSGLPVDGRFDSAEEIAAALRAHRELGLGGGVVIANPIAEAYEIDRGVLDDLVETALEDAVIADVHGKDVTPFLLERIHLLSGGASEFANKQLVYSNALLAAQIALAL